MASAQHTASGPAAARQNGPAPAPRVPEGTRVYAVGDVHGRLDLLTFVLARIAEDAADAPARRVLVGLGDYIDRGPDAAGVLERLTAGPPPGFEAVLLKGNHEDSLLRFLAGDDRAAVSWLGNGGRETLDSYGIEPPPRWAELVDFGALRRALRQAVPAAHLALLSRLAACHREGGYLFAHAGVRPGVDLDTQSPDDLMWIREPFLSSDADLGAVVVHGHSITPEPVVRSNRIGIDTGAYQTNRLTCLVLEGRARRFLNRASR